MLFGFGYPVSQPAPQAQPQTNVYQAMQLVGQQVKINRGGPDSVSGVLLAIPGDYLVVSTKTGIVYVNGSHVKSITEGSASGGKSSGKSGGKSGGRSAGRTGGTPYIAAPSFNSLLTRLRHQFIQINRGGPEKVEGFLAESNSNFLLLIVKREHVRIPIFHIKTVNISEKNQSNGNKNNDNKNNDNKNKSGNKSGNRSGNRSGQNNQAAGAGAAAAQSGNRHTGGGRNRNNKNGRRG